MINGNIKMLLRVFFGKKYKNKWKVRKVYKGDEYTSSKELYY